MELVGTSQSKKQEKAYTLKRTKPKFFLLKPWLHTSWRFRLEYDIRHFFIDRQSCWRHIKRTVKKIHVSSEGFRPATCQNGANPTTLRGHHARMAATFLLCTWPSYMATSHCFYVRRLRSAHWFYVRPYALSPCGYHVGHYCTQVARKHLNHVAKFLVPDWWYCRLYPPVRY